LTLLDQAYYTRVKDLRSNALSGCYEAFLNTKTSLRIALIDGMPDLSHKCFINANIEVDSSLVNQVDEESLFHGTSVASTITSSGDESLGLCKNSTLICLPVLDHQFLNNTLNIKTIDSRLARAVNLAVKYRVDIIQMSLEFNPNFSSGFKQLITAILLAARKGIRIIISAGNTGLIGYNKVLGVGGVVPVTAYGDGLIDNINTNLGTIVGLRGFQAPGYQIPIAIPGNQFRYANGSSYAAAFITSGYLFTRQQLNTTSQNAWNAIYESHYPERKNHSIVPPRFNIKNVCSFLTGRN
jgi:hypothetical protein